MFYGALSVNDLAPLKRYNKSTRNWKKGWTEHHVKNAGDFIKKIKRLPLEPNNILVSFGVTSLFRKISLDTAMDELKKRLRKEDLGNKIANLVNICAKSFFFALDGRNCYAGILLSPLIVYMGPSRSSSCRWLNWRPSVGSDTSTTSSSSNRTDRIPFLDHNNIKFTMEIETYNKLPLLDVVVTRKYDGKLRSTGRRRTRAATYIQSHITTMLRSKEWLTHSYNKRRW